ncbi:hypothetical protein XBFFL1_2280024 [Xenorhabdus bovienii str. feltiae Florida]|nr:hypothetical protein XBFFL1_2280024 [Xenorhabdus bovienii str. feltiae Florida]
MSTYFSLVANEFAESVTNFKLGRNRYETHFPTVRTEA